MGGKCVPFGPLEGALMAASGDAHSTMIEVYPERATLDIPNRDDKVVIGENPSPSQTWPFHVFLSVPLESDQVEQIGAREGWRAKDLRPRHAGSQAVLPVIEFRLENRLMIEVVSPAMAREYEDLAEGRSDLDDERSRIAALDASDPRERASLTDRQALSRRLCAKNGARTVYNAPRRYADLGGFLAGRSSHSLKVRSRPPRSRPSAI
jgi:hypothetical protein